MKFFRFLVMCVVICSVFNAQLMAQISAGTYGFDSETSGAKNGPSGSVSWTSSDNIKFTGTGTGSYSISIAAGGGADSGGAGDQFVQVNRTSGTFTEQTIESNDLTEFGLSSLFVNPFGPGGNSATIQFEGFKNGVSTGTQTENLAYAVWAEVDLTSSGNFADVDRIVVTHTAGLGNFGLQVDEMVVVDAGSSAPAAATVAATVFLEGAYNGTSLNTTINSNIPTTQPYSINGHTGGSAGSIPTNAVDWVLVELREAGSAAAALNSTKVGSAAGFLMNDGTIKATDGTSDLTISLSGNTGADFYVVIYHRNHLPIMSANAISESSGKYTIDFTSSSANTYQMTTALASLSNSKFGMPSGDINQDGSINGTDLSSWRTDNGKTFNYASNGTKDLNLDGVINAVDRNDFYRKNTSKTRRVPST